MSIIRRVGWLQTFYVFNSFWVLQFYSLYVWFSVADLPIKTDTVYWFLGNIDALIMIYWTLW